MEEENKKKIEFWLNDPNVLLKHLDFFPTESMSYEEKLNAISRLLLVCTLLLFFYTREIRTLIIGAITLGAIYISYVYHVRENPVKKEGFDMEADGTPATDILAEKGIELDKEKIFDKPTPENPFSNVMLTDYAENPNKKPALPAEGSADIVTDNAKKMVMKMNPNQPDLAEKLFRDLGDKYVFEQSLRPFYSTPNTMIPNDIQTFTDFCYGSMVSCKEGNMFACARDAARHINP